MRKVISWALCGCLIGAIACSKDAPEAGTQHVAETGTLNLALQTVSESGKVYRLRQATFFVDGTSSATLQSEDDPTSPVLETFLAEGGYQIFLIDGWFIEQVDELLGTSSFVDATLLSDPFQFFEIFSNGETFVRYDFEVDGERISFPSGRLIVGIGIQERNGGNPFCGNGQVDPGEQCDVFDLNGETCASVTMGSAPFGFLQCTSFCAFDTSACEGFGGAGGQGGVGGLGGMGANTGMGGLPDGGPFEPIDATPSSDAANDF